MCVCVYTYTDTRIGLHNMQFIMYRHTRTLTRDRVRPQFQMGSDWGWDIKGFQSKYIHIYVYTYVCIKHAYMHAYIRSYIHTYIHMYARTHTHMHAHAYIHAYIPTHTHTYPHKYPHIHTYIYIHLWKSMLFQTPGPLPRPHTHIHTLEETLQLVLQWPLSVKIISWSLIIYHLHTFPQLPNFPNFFFCSCPSIRELLLQINIKT